MLFLNAIRRAVLFLLITSKDRTILFFYRFVSRQLYPSYIFRVSYEYILVYYVLKALSKDQLVKFFLRSRLTFSKIDKFKYYLTFYICCGTIY